MSRNLADEDMDSDHVTLDNLALESTICNFLCGLREECGDIENFLICVSVAARNFSISESDVFRRAPQRSEAKLMPSNVFSVSAATGIPRETVRRKTQRLCEMGLLERIGRKLYVTTKFLSLARGKREGLAAKLRMMARVEPGEARAAVLPHRLAGEEQAKAAI